MVCLHVHTWQDIRAWTLLLATWTSNNIFGLFWFWVSHHILLIVVILLQNGVATSKQRSFFENTKQQKIHNYCLGHTFSCGVQTGSASESDPKSAGSSIWPRSINCWMLEALDLAFLFDVWRRWGTFSGSFPVWPTLGCLLNIINKRHKHRHNIIRGNQRAR